MADKIDLSLSEKEFFAVRAAAGLSYGVKAIRRRHIHNLQHRAYISIKDLPEDPCVRCGYFIFSTDWVFKLFGKTDPMKPACSLHDSLYDRQLNGGIARKKADEIFLEAMKAIVREGKGSYTQAYIYYYIARGTGWLFF